MNALQTTTIQAHRANSALDEFEAPLAATRDAIDLRWLMTVFRRRLWLFLAVAAAVFLAVAAYVVTATPVYTSTASVMLDTRQLQVLPTNQELISGAPDDSSLVDTQVEAAASRKVTDRVVTALGLDHDPEFNGTLDAPSALDQLKGFVKGLIGRRAVAEASDPQDVHNDVVTAVQDAVTAKRSGTADIIDIAFTSEDPAKAARIANQFAQAYLEDQQQADVDAMGRAGLFLQSRLNDLARQAQSDADAVSRYRLAHNLLSTTSTTLSEQEISNLNQQIASAASDAAADEARLITAREQLARGSTGDDVGAAIDSPVVGQLRTQRALISGQVAQLMARYGPRHPEILKAQGQLRDIDSQIQAEIDRIISNLQAKVKVSAGRLASMQGSLATAKGELARNNVALVESSRLQQAATASQTVYDSYLSRFKEAGAQLGVQPSRSRVISPAQPPSAPSAPKTTLFLLLGMVLGVAAGVGAIILREAADPALVTAEDVERRLRAPYLGSVPLLASVERSRIAASDLVVKRPKSAFSEAIRSLRATIMHLTAPGKSAVMAVTSALPGEGKTLTAACIGRSAALAGARVVVVDCDLTRPGLGRMLKDVREPDLVSVLEGAPLDDALVWDGETGMAWLPVATGRESKADVLASPAMDALLATLRARFDLIVLDTAPVLPVADGRLLAAKSDITLLLARWRRTPDHAIKAALRVLASAGASVDGVVLTKMDVRQQTRFGFGDSAFYFKSYRSYFSRT